MSCRHTRPFDVAQPRHPYMAHPVRTTTEDRFPYLLSSYKAASSFTKGVACAMAKDVASCAANGTRRAADDTRYILNFDLSVAL
jgi:hypothetical protein